MKNNKQIEKIDFVIIWVDGDDPEWQKEYNKYRNVDGDKRNSRFRDMELLQYWFRGVEKFTPWVNKIYFVTCGQKPTWLNTNHPKLVCINHKDYIPKQYLPTFSSHTIEDNLHRIKDLSERFVYFNDDTFIIKSMQPEDFFKNGLPCESAVMNYSAPRKEPLNLVPFVNVATINRNFIKKDVLRKNLRKFFSFKYNKYLIKNFQFIIGTWFPGFKYFHLPTSFLKSTFEEVWQKEYDLLDKTSSHKFRVLTDVNQWLFKDWQICSGKFYPRNTNIGYYAVIDSDTALYNAIAAMKKRKYKLFCANDEDYENFDLMKSELKKAFNDLLPEKSKFEI